jgi:hypothetical protein
MVGGGKFVVKVLCARSIDLRAPPGQSPSALEIRMAEAGRCAGRVVRDPQERHHLRREVQRTAPRFPSLLIALLRSQG